MDTLIALLCSPCCALSLPPDDLQLLVWDVRKAPSASQRNAAAVMSFGGPPTREDHGLLASIDVGGLLTAAVPSLLYHQEFCIGSAGATGTAGIKQGLLQPVGKC
jgi:hypothetical protein